MSIPDLSSGPITLKADPTRSGWYPNQPGLNPGIVGSTSFGRLFKTVLPLTPNEIILAQPLVYDGTLFVVTEGNDVYSLDAATGAVLASRALGPSFDATQVGIGCGDLPLVGITGTPVIDQSTGTAYFFSKTYKPNSSVPAWYAHAVDAQTLVERLNFPVEIAGDAANDPSIQFDPLHEMQRPGLLLMGGAVYAAFGAHCDVGEYHGFIVGVGLTGGIQTMFATEAGSGSARGAGIWMSGAGIMSDGPGQILFTTGNGYSNSMVQPIPGTTPPGTLDNSFVRLSLQSDGTLKATDFFAPYNEAMLDSADLDLGSSGPMALPDCYGTTQYPHLALTGGKSGDVFLINRDNMGGFQEGPSAGDNYVSTVTANGGMWAGPTLWPGDGRWAYVMPKTSRIQALRVGVRTDGTPALAAIGQTADTFGYFSGTPIVTSNGLTSGSAVLWAVYTTSAWQDGQIRAYNAVPDTTDTLPLLYQDTFGKSSKSQAIGVGNGRVYVGTSEGAVVGYGAAAPAPLTAPAIDFGIVLYGKSATTSVVLTAAQATTVTAIASANSAYTIGTTSPALPATLAPGNTLTVPVTFLPTTSRDYVSSLTVTTSSGAAGVSVRGTCEKTSASLRSTLTKIRFGGVAIGATMTESVVLTNGGNQPFTFGASTLPQSPFNTIGVPPVGTVLAPGQSVLATVAFSPTAAGNYSDTLSFAGNSSTVSIPLTGTSGVPPVLSITPMSLNFPPTAIGSSSTLSFTISNPGGPTLTITKSKPPVASAFTAVTSLPEGTSLPPGASVTERVSFSPTSAGDFIDQWVIGSSAASGTQYIAMHGFVGNGTGLLGTYFNSPTLDTAQVAQEVDPVIDFNWATPPNGITSAQYSMRWTGQVQPFYSQTYTFTTSTDDGVRLWVNGTLLIDQWMKRVRTTNKATMDLVAGRLYDIVLEHYNAGGSSQVRLQWSCPSTPNQDIPAASMYPTSESDASAPGGDASAPASDAAAPGSDATAPGSDATAPGDDASAPGSDASAPEVDASAPLDDGSAPADDASAE
jgi:hypothetical protein